ncbi:MAG: FkbM family methyltransferase [Candidatus Omnitrophica bacterium]|nr:FkbM family methyltransferase [Candidatus Omnitrophota bacterium]
MRGHLGRLGALEYAVGLLWCDVWARRGIAMKGALIRLHVRGLNTPLYVRYGTSDPMVFRQVFIDHEYACLTVESPRWIVDCGGNVGYTALYYLRQYPAAQLIVIEPDGDNLALCRRNLRAYRDRVALVCAGVWSHRAGLKVVRGQYRDGKEWATQVRECAEGEVADVEAVSLTDVLAANGVERVDILKVDIEQSERVVFAKGYAPWLNRTKNIVIELHDDECEQVFFQALQPYRYQLSRSGESTVVRNLSLRNR